MAEKNKQEKPSLWDYITANRPGKVAAQEKGTPKDDASRKRIDAIREGFKSR